MEKRQFGKTDMQVSLLGFGGAEIGYLQIPQDQVATILNGALDAGLNVVDTAECYRDSEMMIGNTIAHRRNDYYLFTKCGHEGSYTNSDWSYRAIEKSIDRSLERLKTDHLDLVQLHSCDEAILRQGEVIEVLQHAKEKGKTRYIGYSGDGNDAIYAINTGVFDTLQTSVSIADQESIERVLPLTEARGMGVIAKRPIANAAWRYPTRPDNDYHIPYWERLQELQYDFLSAENVAEIALRFTLSVPGVHTAIVGTTRPDRWLANAKEVAKGPLATVEFDAIRKRWHEIARPDWVGQI